MTTSSAESASGNRVSDHLKAVSKASQKSPEAGKTRVLIVEDAEDMLEGLVAVVRSWGYSVHEERDGHNAIFLALAETPEIVITDLNMPGINGFEFARFIRRQLWGDTVLLIAHSAWSSEEVRQSTLEAGFDHFIRKPADLDELKRLLAGG